MTIYIALLRGINVGGHNLMKMQDLKNLLVNMGLVKVHTYIQSGNIVFQSDKSVDQLQSEIEQKIKDVFGFSIKVILRTALEWKKVIKDCPYPVDDLIEGESVHIALLEREPVQESIDQLLEFKSETEVCYINGTEIYLFLSQGMRNSKLAIKLQKLGVPVTLRNWKTIKKIETMIKAINY